jgi:uncharacterized integral membrane protein (TIGR00697 family)
MTTKKAPKFNAPPMEVKPQYLTFLLMLYVTFSLAGNSVLFKLVQIDFLTGPGGILVIPLILLLEDIIAEVYGYKISRTLLWYILISELLFSFLVISIIHVHSPSYWHEQTAFNDVFGSLLQGTPILVLGVFSGRFLNLYIITKLKILMKGRYFWIRSIFSCLCGDLVTLTIIFTFLFDGMPLETKAHLYLSDLFMRVLYSIFGGGLGMFIVRFLKKKEGLDVYDFNTNFNPFKLDVNK